MNLAEQLEQAEAHAASIRRQLVTADCRAAGCDMQHAGGRNAGCGEGCNCSIPVYVCTRCGDSDYGDNQEARDKMAECAAMPLSTLEGEGQ